MKRLLKAAWLVSVLASVAVPFTGAQLLSVPKEAVEAVQNKVDIQADQLEYKSDTDTMIGRGNVVIRKMDQLLTCDLVTYNTVTEEAHARGNVIYKDSTQEWNGEELTYNFITGQGSFPESTLDYDIFKVGSVELDRVSDVHLTLRGVTITTCDTLENPEFKVRATSADVYEETIVRARNAVFFLRGVPFLYLPRYTLDLEREQTNVDLVPGYGSRDGVFLLAAYNRYVEPGYRTKTHFDSRSERGFAVGHDLIWYDEEQNRDTTVIKAYYAQDNSPYDDQEEEDRLRGQGVDVDEQRYRIKLRHTHQFSDRDALRARGTYLSDARVERDFFRDDFRQDPVPENRASYTYSGDEYSAGLLITHQVNSEFFGGLSRLPEAYVDVPLRQIGETEFMYESETSASALERTYSDFEQQNGAEEYDSTRFHTAHRLYYPTRHFGWLNFTPRVGVTYTHYGNTRGQESRVSTSSSTDTNGVVTTSFSTNTVAVARSGDARILPEVGFETSFKGFKELHDGPTLLGRGLRHVIEPFANYTYIPEPDLLRDEIYQFDSIDRLGETHSLGFGVRNKWQTRRVLKNGETRIHDFADVEIRSNYDLRSEVDEPLGTIRLDADLQPTRWARLEADVRYDPDEGEISSINTELRLRNSDTGSSISLDQLYRVDRNHTLQLSYRINPYGKVGLDGYTRYELEEEGLEEQMLMLRTETDCVGYGLGGSWLAGDDGGTGADGEDEFKVWFQLWLTAMPKAVLGVGSR